MWRVVEKYSRQGLTKRKSQVHVIVFRYLFLTNETVSFPVERPPPVSIGLEFAQIRGIS